LTTRKRLRVIYAPPKVVEPPNHHQTNKPIRNRLNKTRLAADALLRKLKTRNLPGEDPVVARKTRNRLEKRNPLLHILAAQAIPTSLTLK